MRLLILEDDDGIRTTLRMAMEDEGYDVVEYASAEAALAAVDAVAQDVALMLVDLMLSGMDGLTFIHRVRAHTDVPIVVISARADTYDIVTALEAGADDYVVKPFQIKEITARLRALQRRGRRLDGPADASAGDGPGAQLVLDRSLDPPLVLWSDAGELRRGQDAVHLTLTEFRLLSELAASAGRVLSRQILLARIWDRGFFGDERIVDVHIRRLRTKIEADPAVPRLVVTVRGLGYRLDPV